VASLFGLSKLWPFRTPSGTKAEASHQLTVALRTEGVQYAAVPLLSEWTEKWDCFGTDSATVALLAQMEEMGHVEQLDGGIWLGWEALYQLLNTEDGEPSELLALLKLPDLTDFRPSLSSQGSLEDLDFRITLGEWVNASGEKLAPPPEIMGAVIKIADCQRLLVEPVWRLVREVRQFYTTPLETRSALGNRRTWGAIRRYAQAADAPMADFLQRTVVLTPEKLSLQMHKSAQGGAKTVQVEPGFAGAPSRWLETFDKFATVPERYDITDGEGIVQVLIAPQVRSVLQEIRRWPGRRVAGQRAEAFIRNPYASLGDDALAVIDEAQFEEARAAAGIEFERFSVAVERGKDGSVSGVALLIESASSNAIRTSRYDFPDADRLEDFIHRFERRIQGGYQCFVWEGYELEILGDAEDQLAELKAILDEWRQPSIVIRYADVFDLGRYSERVDGIGVEKGYVSAFIARKSEGEGWIPDNIFFGVSFTPENAAEPSLAVLSEEGKLRLQDTISQAEHKGVDEVSIPGVDKPVSVGEAKRLLETLQTTEDLVKRGEFDPQQRKHPAKALLLKSNIQVVNYRENRKQVLELPRDRKAIFPRALRKDVSLKQHQKIGVAWLQHLWANIPDHCRGALLADDMGLGKTLQILTFVARILEDDPKIDPILIIAPVSLLDNWKEELEKFFMAGAMPVLTLYGDDLSAKKLSKSEIDPQLINEGIVRFLAPNWLGDAKLVLTTYETLRDLEFSLAVQHWSVMVCDEAQKIKNPNALVTRAAKKQNVRFKIACTGTPVENSLADLWSLFDFVQPGLLGALNDFGNRYRRPIEAKTDEEKSRVDELKMIIEPQTLRRLKTQVAKDLPDKIEVMDCRNLPMSPYQRQLYGQAIETYRAKKSDGPIKNHLGLIQHLRQICSSPYPIGCRNPADDPLDEREIKSPKLKWLLEVLAHIKRKREKVIIFVEFHDLQRQLQRYIRERLNVSPDIINGSTSAAASAANSRQKRIKMFQEREGLGVIILSPLAVGFGVNIQAANHVIHYTRSWNPAKEDQATDRAYRIGQTKDVYVYYPVITADFITFDMKLDKLLTWKRGLSDDMLNGCGDLSASDFADLGSPKGGAAFQG